MFSLNSLTFGSLPAIEQVAHPIIKYQFPSTLGQNLPEITVLTSLDHPVNKRFTLGEDGEVQKQNYQYAYLFDATKVQVNGINDLAHLIEYCSQDSHHILIRGLPVGSDVHRIRKTGENFAEHVEGSHWVMLDFDDILVPDGIDALSTDAIEWVITQLPPAFHNVSYFYQHSSSAGVLNSDGTPMKSGLNVHLFFWLNRRIQGKPLTAYLLMHCMESGFYKLERNNGGVVDLTCGIDPAPIRNAVQAHYIASPTIDAGVDCRLTDENRQGLIEKVEGDVILVELTDDIELRAKTTKAQLVNNYKRSHGYVTKVLQTQVQGRMALTRYSAPPDSSPSEARGGRTFIEGRLDASEEFLTLFFEGEGTRGSWYVHKPRPQMGVRHGDGASMPLKELSQGAHDYVRDTLRWFEEVPHQHLDLVSGFLPSITDFAKAKVSLVLSPTGSGKTTAALNWIRDRIEKNQLVLYAAPTIALVKQMRDDLTQAGLSPRYYSDVSGYMDFPRSGVIVTTNMSLPKLLGWAYDNGVVHSLIFDEIHQSLDEFMNRNSRQKQMEDGLSKARQSLLLTGTLTDVQRLSIVDIAKHALGGLTGEDYCCYEFSPFKRNPLWVLPTARFDSDFVTMLESIQGKVESGEPVPRFVMLLDTSKMDMYRSLVGGFGLSEQALIVSRQENTEEEIEAARISDKPILISSPLFGLGLNFSHAPEQLWCRFDHVQADVNQIIQAVNRANRGDEHCEVRIYGNVDVNAKFKLPSKTKLKAEIAERFHAEATLAGCLEDHFLLDRVTYLALRHAEKNSSVALSSLVRDNAIQNFDIVDALDLPEVDKDKAEVAKQARGQAREGYLQPIVTVAAGIDSCLPWHGLMMLDDLYKERKDSWKTDERRVEREIQYDEFGIIMAMCGIGDPVAVQRINVIKVKRLFGEISPWVSGQYDRERFPVWAQVEAEKTDRLIVLVNKLQGLTTGTISAYALSGSLTRNAQMGQAFQALAASDLEFQTIGQKIEALRPARDRVRVRCGRAERIKVEKQGLALLRDLLEPLGVTYGKKMQRGREVADDTKPIIPPNWDLAEMLLILKRQAVRLRALPNDQAEPIAPEIKYYFDDEVMPRQICERCTLFYQNGCVMGLPVDWQSHTTKGYRQDCAGFKAIRPELMWD